MTRIQILFIDIIVQTSKKLTHICLTFVICSSFHLGNPMISRVSLLEYYSFAHHCLSASTRRDDNSEFVFLATTTSASSVSNLSFMSFNCCKTGFLSFILLKFLQSLRWICSHFRKSLQWIRRLLFKANNSRTYQSSVTRPYLMKSCDERSF